MKPEQSAFQGVAHVTIPVRDIVIAERFFVDVMGGHVGERMDAAQLEKTHPGVPLNPRSIYLGIEFGSATQLALFIQQDGQPAPTSAHPHIAIQIAPEAIDPFMAHLKDNEVPFLGPLRRGPVGQVSVYFNDPWGNHFEFIADDYQGETTFAPPRFATILHNWTPPGHVPQAD